MTPTSPSVGSSPSRFSGERFFYEERANDTQGSEARRSDELGIP